MNKSNKSKGVTMKRFTITSLAVAMTLMFAISVFAQDETTEDETAEKEWSPNLLINPSAEAQLGDEWQIENGDLWDYVGSFRNIFPYKGDYFYMAVGTTNITQQIDISPYASFIDSGEAEVKVGAWFVSPEDAKPKCSFKAKFYDQNASYVDEGSTAISCSNDNGWIERQAIMTVPPKQEWLNLNFKLSKKKIIVGRVAAGMRWIVI
ncbi:secreted protein [Beggiatoa sp. PS]|nr:secreted protein [Beggiatoa sp. PS]